MPFITKYIAVMMGKPVENTKLLLLGQGVSKTKAKMCADAAFCTTLYTPRQDKTRQAFISSQEAGLVKYDKYTCKNEQ